MSFGQVVKWGAIGLVTIAGIGVATSILSAVTAPLRGGAGVVSRTFEAGNIERTYELFHDRYQGFQSRVAQIREMKSAVETATDSRERSNLSVELRSVRDNCRRIVEGYNSDSAKTTREIFRGRSLPETLPLEECNR